MLFGRQPSRQQFAILDSVYRNLSLIFRVYMRLMMFICVVKNILIRMP